MIFIILERILANTSFFLLFLITLIFWGKKFYIRNEKLDHFGKKGMIIAYSCVTGLENNIVLQILEIFAKFDYTPYKSSPYVYRFLVLSQVLPMLPNTLSDDGHQCSITKMRKNKKAGEDTRSYHSWTLRNLSRNWPRTWNPSTLTRIWVFIQDCKLAHFQVLVKHLQLPHTLHQLPECAHYITGMYLHCC